MATAQPYISTDGELASFLGQQASEEANQRERQTLLATAHRWWDARTRFRSERREAVDYYRSRQWGGTITTPDGKTTTEKEYIESQGRMPMVMNLVSNVINSVEGQFRQNASDRAAFATGRTGEEAVRMINLARRATRRYNDSEVLEADGFKEHILSGASCFKQSFEWDARLNRHEVTDYGVDQTRLFYNLDLPDRRFSNPTGTGGLRIIGELHDIPLEEVIARFARSKQEAKQVEELYGKTRGNTTGLAVNYGFETATVNDFYAAVDPSLCRVVEIWTPKYQWVRTGLDPLFTTIPEGYGEITAPDNVIAKEQNRRRELGLPLLEMDAPRYEPHWCYYFMTPTGHLLEEGTTPFWHGEHPYTPGLTMLIDGETWGMVTNIKDPQRWLNRLLAHIDHAMGTGAKGAMAYDRAFTRDNGLTDQDVTDWYTSADQAMGVDLPNGKSMKQFVETFVQEKLPAGYVELIPMLTGFVEKISGVTEAMQGYEPKSGTPASLYQQQISQSSANVLGYLESYFEMLRRKDLKQVQLLQQAITEPRTFADQANQGQPVTVRPEQIKNVHADVAIANVADTATYRMMWEDYLFKMMEGGKIPTEVYFQESAHPKAQQLLVRLTEHKEAQLLQQIQLAQVAQEMGGDSEDSQEQQPSQQAA